MSLNKNGLGQDIPDDHFENDGGDPTKKLSPQAEAANDALIKRLTGGEGEKPAPKAPDAEESN